MCLRINPSYPDLSYIFFSFLNGLQLTTLSPLRFLSVISRCAGICDSRWRRRTTPKELVKYLECNHLLLLVDS
jgi:hypothetical protein